MSTLDLGYTQEKVSSIRHELDPLNIEEDVILKAEDIYNQLGSPIKRNGRRKMMLLFCVYNAYKQLGFQKDPRDVAFAIGLDKTKVSKALKMFVLKAPQSSLIERINPEIFVKEYFEMTGLAEEHLVEIQEWLQRILIKDPSLAITIQPQRLAAVVIMYYMSTNGIPYDISLFEQRLNIKENSIKIISKKIIAIDNS